ncbi:MAG: LicD family protein [Lachnospiraceae bacterium]|jgi:lipopolysaccharide cholinephosphotransferase|nr:LicD family protein [Lachnospiraceae bacterium]
MLTVTKDQLRKIQIIELEMLEEVDRICKKCNIRYNIIAGTLLGAVRHGGFIPWDDDADVAFLRPEYEKFRQACKTELDTTRFVFQDHRNTKGYRWGYGKLRRKNTLFLREHQEEMPYFQGIFIDIFPLDAVPDHYCLRTIKNFECFCVRKILWSKVGKKADKNPVKRKIFEILDKIPEEKIFAYYHQMIKRARNKKTKMVRILMFPTPNSEWGYLRYWYENSADMEFEGKVFQGIKDYDSYLSFKFGEYRKLPPLSMRKVHPVSQIRLTSKV